MLRNGTGDHGNNYGSVSFLYVHDLFERDQCHLEKESAYYHLRCSTNKTSSRLIFPCLNLVGRDLGEKGDEGFPLRSF